MCVRVRRIAAHEGALLRDIRVRALADAPSAFAMTLDQELAKPAADWEIRASRSATSDESTTVVATTRDGEWVGMAGGYRPQPGDRNVELVSMWVDSAHRGRGLGRTLVDAVVAWAAETGAQSVALWVTRGNHAAQRLYESAGFSVTGDVQPLPSDPSQEELRMIRHL